MAMGVVHVTTNHSMHFRFVLVDNVFTHICVMGNSCDADYGVPMSEQLDYDSTYAIFDNYFSVLVSGNRVNGYSANLISDSDGDLSNAIYV